MKTNHTVEFRKFFYVGEMDERNLCRVYTKFLWTWVPHLDFFNMVGCEPKRHHFGVYTFHRYYGFAVQEAQLMLTNPREAFTGQSKLPNIVPFDVRYGFLLVCNRNLMRKTQFFLDIRLQKCGDLENQVRGPSRSLEMSSFDRQHMTSY